MKIPLPKKKNNTIIKKLLSLLFFQTILIFHFFCTIAFTRQKLSIAYKTRNREECDRREKSDNNLWWNISNVMQIFHACYSLFPLANFQKKLHRYYLNKEICTWVSMRRVKWVDLETRRHFQWFYSDDKALNLWLYTGKGSTHHCKNAIAIK